MLDPPAHSDPPEFYMMKEHRAVKEPLSGSKETGWLFFTVAGSHRKPILQQSGLAVLH